MATSTLDLKQRFYMALAVKKMSAAQWAKERKYAPGHVCAVLDGRVSQKLTDMIEEWTADTLKAHRVRLSA